jgi:hypothetical protein
VNICNYQFLIQKANLVLLVPENLWFIIRVVHIQELTLVVTVVSVLEDSPSGCKFYVWCSKLAALVSIP